MITASVYDSKYKGGDGVERNTKYNQNFVLNILAGKKFTHAGRIIWPRL